MSLAKIFQPKPNKFMLLLVEQTDLTVQGLHFLKQYMQKRNSEVAKQVSKKEKEADEVRRVLIDELMRTFITPFDREDIFALSRDIDDVLDYAYTTVDEMEVLDVSPTPYMGRMASLLHDAAEEIDLAMHRLSTRHYAVASEHAQRAKALENRVEAVYREAIADLFQEPKNLKQMVNLLKTREIYRHLSNAADREDGAANLIHDIIMKMS
jgi:predicted phosphate transport protein (TIGR00153 family)